MLVEQGNAKVNATNAIGQTAFYQAAQKDKVEVMEYLLKNGAEINQPGYCNPIFGAQVFD